MKSNGVERSLSQINATRAMRENVARVRTYRFRIFSTIMLVR